ncbi:helicase-exonuclease AddAB subunit AddA [Lactiplantibacillus garii]|uniref:ATP-dependent helicase/nuclease subunit A n=1 Tax=Lactiplantibacillus garii TaxID=2306423 RepID=A0A426D7U5_9LACO|nr:helicase-exonuclease AddAB subunit AddA [Lactiplantibacillus garii]RRK10665.1 helicase-exonuclease AddAB subunit AddA [Lactiplantibacillus garii]
MSAKTQYTESQQAVISQQGNNLLVSASAGSGKTTVLIERIMRKILAGTNVDQLLVVTFTNLAAKHMKQKLESQINKRISQLMTADASKTTADPAVQRLRQQLNLLGVANISTLDAFCLRVIQRYYYVIDLDPVFRLLTDNTEGLLIRDQVWDAVREKLYAEDGQLFDLLTANFSNDRSDDGLGQLVFRLFDFAQSTPDPEAWLTALPKNYHLEGSELTATDFYQQRLLPLLRQTLETLVGQMKQAVQIAETAALAPKTILAVQTAQADLTTLATELPTASWNTVRTAVTGFKVGRMTKTYKTDPEKTARAQAMGNLVDDVKKQMGNLAESYFAADEEQVLDVMTGAEAIVRELVRATQRFKAAFALEKRRRHVLDFSDLEHLTLAILTNDSESGRGALAQLKAQFEEVMVDEYQDINSLQETILQLLSRKDPGNMFMVGDVKQSIYQFRLADPLLFLHKYHDFGANPSHGDRIVLAENFRSVENVDNFTNLIFSQLMDAPVGQIEYDQAAYLKYGPKDYPEDMPQTTSLLLYQTGTDTPDESTQHQAVHSSDEEGAEVAFSIDDPSIGSITMVAQKILALKKMAHPIFDRSTGRYRPFRFSDAALLVPTRNHNLTIIDIFKQYHIPIVVNDAQNYFQTTEIRIMMALLSVIDNPYQDIPLVAVLRSPIVGLDENQLVYLRIQNKTSDYFQAVRDFYQRYPTAADHSDYGDKLYAKVETFMRQLTEFRDLARRNQIVTLIWRIYEQTGFLDYVGGMPAGPQRQANLHALYERAYTYEQGSFKGLFQFVRFIKRMQEKDQDLAAAVAETDTEAVSVMTIHGSKGLEYPVIFLMDMDKRFNQTDTRANALMDREAGIGINYLDPEQRVKYPTLPRLVIQQVVSQKLRAEEMRKLYVAITRAQQQLFLVGTIESIDAATAKWRKGFGSSGRVLSAQVRTSTNNQLDWVGMALMRHPLMKDYWGDEWPTFTLDTDPTKFTLELGDAQSIGQRQTTSTVADESAVSQVEQAVTIDVDQMTRDNLTNLLNFQYGHQVSTVTTAYQSVSEVKRIFEDPDTARMNANPTVSAKRARPTSRFVTGELEMPQFLQTTREPTSAEVGSATHLVLEQLDLTQPVNSITVQTTIDDLVAKRVLTEPLAKLINVDAVVGFYASELGQQILAAPANVHREVPFSLLLPARQLFTELDVHEHARVLIHGIIDGYFETPNGLILFDYKTDHVKQPADLLTRYAGQVELYAAALRSMYQRPVVQQYLYSLPQRTFVDVPQRKTTN